MSRDLRSLFQKVRPGRGTLFLPYICLGYPDYRSSLEAAKAALRAGASGLELGVPFSDPIADGPILQAATFGSLARGTKFRDVFRLVRDLRKAGFRQPLLVMTYLNLVERMGWEDFAKALARAGGDGAIVPDLPLEEIRSRKKVLAARDLDLIPFLAPTSTDRRVRMADAVGAPFLYYVSVTGVTGARKSLAVGLLRTRRAFRALRTPVVVGFGISTPAQAASVGRRASGIIIGSALAQLLARTPKAGIGKAVEAYCRRIVSALKRSQE